MTREPLEFLESPADWAVVDILEYGITSKDYDRLERAYTKELLSYQKRLFRLVDE